jgi:trehalose 6-phosphate synthase
MLAQPAVPSPSPSFRSRAASEPDAFGTWTADRLQHWLRSSAERDPVLVLAQRAPGARRGGNGPATSVEPLIRACSGVWITADEAAASTASTDPFRVQTLTIDAGDRRAANSFAHEALWPLCHRAHVKPTFRADDFTTYWRVNAQFADAVDAEYANASADATRSASPLEHAAGQASPLIREAGQASPLILVQDYHFALAPLLIRERRPSSRIVTFWHIPWPDWQTFESCPWGQHLLEGLLGSSILGFQTPLDCRNFIETVERCLGAHIDRHQEAVTYDGRHVLVRAYPASVRWPDWWASCVPNAEVCRDSIRQQLRLPADVRLGIGVDRLDHAKGIEEKFLAIERLLECYPEFRGRFVFAQLAAPCHEGPAPCRELRARVHAIRDRVNRTFATGALQPIHLIEAEHAPSYVNMCLRAADFCYVGSLHDGMHLVAKEFVAARDDERGVLALSTFAGAARELTDALILNPYDIDGTASVLARALTMTDDEQIERMRRLRAVVAEFSAWRWAAHILSDAARLRRQR